MWSLWSMRPPVHRKLSVTATFGSFVVMPGAFRAFSMHIFLWIRLKKYIWIREKGMFGLGEKGKQTNRLHGIKLTFSPSLANTSFSATKGSFFVRKLSRSRWFFNRSCSVNREYKTPVDKTDRIKYCFYYHFSLEGSAKKQLTSSEPSVNYLMFSYFYSKNKPVLYFCRSFRIKIPHLVVCMLSHPPASEHHWSPECKVYRSVWQKQNNRFFIQESKVLQ